jgi:5-bromo-4-chloroindolyl phosphate hydrolysis protein
MTAFLIVLMVAIVLGLTLVQAIRWGKKQEVRADLAERDRELFRRRIQEANVRLKEMKQIQEEANAKKGKVQQMDAADLADTLNQLLGGG